MLEIESKLYLIKEVVMEYHGTKTSVKVNDYLEIKKTFNKNKFKVKTYAKDLRILFPNFVARLIKSSSVFTIRAVNEKYVI